MLGFYHQAFSIVKQRQVNSGSLPSDLGQIHHVKAVLQGVLQAEGQRADGVQARQARHAVLHGPAAQLEAAARGHAAVGRGVDDQGDLVLAEVVQVLAEVLDCLCRDACAAQGLGRAGRCQDRVAQAGELCRKGVSSALSWSLTEQSTLPPRFMRSPAPRKAL